MLFVDVTDDAEKRNNVYKICDNSSLKFSIFPIVCSAQNNNDLVWEPIDQIHNNFNLKNITLSTIYDNYDDKLTVKHTKFKEDMIYKKGIEEILGISDYYFSWVSLEYNLFLFEYYKVSTIEKSFKVRTLYDKIYYKITVDIEQLVYLNMLRKEYEETK